MLINARYDSGKWVVDENAAMLIPEFRDILSDTKLGINAMAFVAIYADPSSFLQQVYTDEDERQKEAFKSVYNDSMKMGPFLANKKVKDAISKYERISNTAELKLRIQFQGAMKNVGDYLEESGEKLDDSNIANFIATLGKMPTLIDSYTDMNKGKREDVENTKKIVRGGRDLTYREAKLRKKK